MTMLYRDPGNRSEVTEAFDVGMVYTAAFLASGEEVVICGRPVRLIWPDGEPDARVLAGFVEDAKNRAVKYNP